MVRCVRGDDHGHAERKQDRERRPPHRGAQAVAAAGVKRDRGGAERNGGARRLGAACSTSISNAGTISGFSNPGTIDCISIVDVPAPPATTVNGDITNNGTISGSTSSPPGIGNGIFVLTNAAAPQAITINGLIINNGTITPSGAGVGIFVGGGSVVNGITNTGSIIAAPGNLTGGIQVVNVQTTSFGNASIVNTDTGTISAALPIQASGSKLNIFNSGTLTASGGNPAIDLTGDISVDTVTIAPTSKITGNVLGNGMDTFQLGGSGSGNFDLSTVGSSQQYQGFTTFNVASGVWNVSNTFGQTQSWNVLGGTLAGTGTLPGVNVSSGATLAPGAPGVAGTSMNITGNLAMASGAIYLVTIGGSTASFANVGGTASINGATVQVNATSAPVISNKPILILHTTGGVIGNFGTQTVFAQNFKAQVSYNPDDAFLTLTANLAPTPGTAGVSACGAGFTVNQCNVGTSLNNFFNNGGALTAPFSTVFGLTGSALGQALYQLDGENATGAERAAFQLTNQFLTLMLDPFVDGRMGGFNTPGAGAIGFAPEQRDHLPDDVALAYASIFNKAPPRPAFDQRWTAWGSAYGGSSNTRGDQAVIGSSNVTANTYGFAAGADYHVSPTTLFGFALAGAGTNWGLANALGTGRSDALQAGVYGTHWMGPAYVGGALSFSNHWFTTNRTALGDGLSAKFDGQSYGARLESGYRFAALPTLGVTPYGAVQFQDFHTAAYSESDAISGGFGLSYPALSATDVRTEIGSRFDAPTLLYGMPLILRGRVAWAHDFVNNPALNPTFESLPGASFTVNGAPIPHDSALTSAGAELFLTSRWTLLAKFDGAFAPGSQTYAGTGTLRYTW